MHDRSKLPRWAQIDLDRLERDVEHWKAKAMAGPKNSNTFIHEWGSGDKPLGASPTVRFIPLKDDGRYVEVHISHGRVNVRTDGLMAFHPSAANSGWIEAVDR